MLDMEYTHSNVTSTDIDQNEHFISSQSRILVSQMLREILKIMMNQNVHFDQIMMNQNTIWKVNMIKNITGK